MAILENCNFLRAKKRLAIAAFISIFAFCPAVYAVQPVNVVEISSFYCPYCFKVNQQIPQIEQAVQKTGGFFDFTPIFWGKISPWPTKIYLGLPKKYSTTVRNAFFTAAQINGLKMKSGSGACVALQDYLPSLTVDQCLQFANSNKVSERLNNVWQLIKHIHTDNSRIFLPIFVIEKQGKVDKVISRSDYSDMNDLVGAVLNEIQS